MIESNRLLRALRHQRFGASDVHKILPDAAMFEIEAAIGIGERRHSGEIRFVIEASLDLYRVWAQITPRERALKLFSDLQVWDTEANNGVLLYVLLADQAVEIVADRALGKVIANADWQKVCADMANAYARSQHLSGTLAAVAAMHALIAPHFPSGAQNLNELPNRPIIV